MPTYIKLPLCTYINNARHYTKNRMRNKNKIYKSRFAITDFSINQNKQGKIQYSMTNNASVHLDKKATSDFNIK